MQPGAPRQRAEGAGGGHDLGSHLQHKEATFGRHQGLEHQSSAIPADWHQPGEGAGSAAAAAPGHVRVTLDTEPPLSRESSSSSDAGSSVSPWAGTWEAAGLYLRLAAWLALLFVGYGFQRGLCAAGLPYDCDSADAADVFNSLTLLTFLGGALAWLAGVTNPARFDWLVAPRRAYLWIVYLAVLPAYSGIASIPAMRVSLATMDQWGPAPIILKVVVGVIGVAAVAFHIWLALRCAYIAADGSVCAACGSTRDLLAVASQAAVAPETKAVPGSPSGASTASGSVASLAPSGGSVTASLAASLKSWASRCQLKLAGGGSSGSSSPAPGSPRALGLPEAPRRLRRAPRGTRRKALAIYLLPRAAVFLYFLAWCMALPLSGDYSLHLHHYVLGWAVACFAAFNHPISGLLLAFGTAIFVQGAGAYGFDPLFSKTHPEGMGCLTVPSPPTGQMTCAFWSDKPFNISFCSNTSYIPWFDCGVDWPWPATKVWPNGKKPNKTARLMPPTPITLSLNG